MSSLLLLITHEHHAQLKHDLAEISVSEFFREYTFPGGQLVEIQFADGYVHLCASEHLHTHARMCQNRPYAVVSCKDVLTEEIIYHRAVPRSTLAPADLIQGTGKLDTLDGLSYEALDAVLVFLLVCRLEYASAELHKRL